MSVLEELRSVVRSAIERAEGDEATTLRELDALFDLPLRVAFAGMVKAGKSTLLNALVGQRVAPTDSGECTRIVTFYERGPRYLVTAVGGDGARTELRFDRGDELVVHLEGRDPEGIDHIEVQWPSERLTDRQLVDTPGLGSLSSDVSARSEQFLVMNDRLPVDAVVYLTRHRHPADLRFLEAFHGGVAGVGRMSSIAVLSRADELAGGRVDALEIATAVAGTMGADPRVRRVAQTVVPVAGLLAETAASFRQAEFDAIEAVAGRPEDETALALLSVDRFLAYEAAGVPAVQRAALVGRLGLFGMRIAVQLVRSGSAPTTAALAEGLSARSGVGDLQHEIRVRFESRRLALRSRVVLASLSQLEVFWRDGDLASRVERIRANAHELAELEALDLVGAVEIDALPDEDLRRLETLLGFDGVEPWRRLGIPAGSSPSVVHAAAVNELGHWREVAEHPLSTPTVRHVAMVAGRTCEAIASAR